MEDRLDLSRLTKEEMIQWKEIHRRQKEERKLPFQEETITIVCLIQGDDEEAFSQAEATLVDMMFEISMLRFLGAQTEKKLAEVVSCQISYLDPDNS